MNWHVHISRTTFDAIARLPDEARDALFDLFRSLEDDPYGPTVPYGTDDGIMREAAFGRWGSVVILVNAHTGRITPVSFTWAG
ncbi:type II toxin-antitoxin system RelE/ParE family toxin [Streptomyces sp. NPDC057654]|uniref:type II toxin-antitoxin system RelE family toxin n=1 Tax=Streptomyces sp. NPDC057654 TaxID=3346196 RepID=UPI0036867098